MTREEKIAEAKRLRAEGLSYAKIGERLGVSRSTIPRWLVPAIAKLNRDKERERYATDTEYRESKKQRYATEPEFRLRHLLGKIRRGATARGYAPCNTTVDELMEAYTGYCNCCGVHESEMPTRLAMDHCHTTGQFRGFLCSKCNMAIGHLRDDPYAAFHYLDPDRAELLFKLLVRSQKPRGSVIDTH